MEDLVSQDGAGPRPLNAVLPALAGARFFVTGHNGFVGSWLCNLLDAAGAQVTGYALAPEPGSLGAALDGLPGVRSIVGDVRDDEHLAAALRASGAEVVLHLAAQALVLASYEDPVGTFFTNTMGTAHLLEAVRRSSRAKACLVVTSDKCYALGTRAHLETDPLGGEDPYSASKAAAELVVHAYRASFAPADGALATTRAGNIVGGGDAAPHRIVPDWARAMRAREPLRLRQPAAIRPWQHVLDAVAGYVRLVAALLRDGPAFAEAWNFGPPPASATTVSSFVELLDDARAGCGLAPAEPVAVAAPGPPERAVLTLDSAKAEHRLGWRPMLDLRGTAEWTVQWYASSLADGFDPTRATRSQVDQYLELEAAAHSMGAEPGRSSPDVSTRTSRSLRSS